MKKLVIGQTVLYPLTAAEKKSYGYDVLPATVLYVYETGNVDIEVAGTGGELFKANIAADAVELSK